MISCSGVREVRIDVVAGSPHRTQTKSAPVPFSPATLAGRDDLRPRTVDLVDSPDLQRAPEQLPVGRSLVHQAIDELTSVMLTLQNLERHSDTLPPNVARERLRTANVALQQLGVLLVEIRNRERDRTGPIV